MRHPEHSIIEDYLAADYHADPATGSSTIRKLQTSTPMHARAMLETPMSSPALALGTALHAAVLEPENARAQALVAPDVDRRTSAGKREYADFLEAAPGRLIITPEQGIQLDGMVQACRADWRIKHALSACKKREVSLFGSVAGFPAKARLDAWNRHGMVLDLKSTRDLAGDFEKSIASYGYGLQAAWYRAVLQSIFRSRGELMPDDFSFVFLVVEASPPHGTAVYRMRDDVMDCYAERMDALQETWCKCVAENKYPGWPQDDVVDIGLPVWAMKKLEEAR